MSGLSPLWLRAVVTSSAAALCIQSAYGAPKGEYSGWHCVTETAAVCAKGVCKAASQPVSLIVSPTLKLVQLCAYQPATATELEAEAPCDSYDASARKTKAELVVSLGERGGLRIDNERSFTFGAFDGAIFITGFGTCESRPPRINVTSISPPASE